MKDDAALVLFSGGQDSATCLAWALDRFRHVETLGFDYGQRHRVELDCRGAFRAAVAQLNPDWGARLGPDHTLRLDALAEVSDTALTREAEIRMGDEGTAQHLRPGSQPAVPHLRCDHRVPAGAEADRRRHVRDRFLRLPRLPGRHPEGASGGAEPRHGAPLRDRDAADVADQGRHLAARGTVGKRGLWSRTVVEHTHTCYLGDRTHRHPWGFGCGTCPACELRAKGWQDFVSERL
jgi:7-cyano-7-deazaguanine synthase